MMRGAPKNSKTRLLLCVLVLVLAAAVLPCRATRGVALTPPLGYNTWNFWSCRVNSTILMDTADIMVAKGLKDAGYIFVNSDDCWMLATRAANGSQIPNPDKFPNGVEEVVAHVHGKGMKMGLYTAAGPHTCAGFAASCDHEEIDARQWADWKIDYMKDDRCSTCRSGDSGDLDDYGAMQKAINDTGHPMVLSIEGGPPFPQSADGYHGNMRRVGHDISANWFSMVSLVDMGSNLWPYAHNGSNGLGGWWNDLDMLEVGNGDFAPSDASDTLNLNRARAHQSMWAVMKAPMLMGTDLYTVTDASLDVMRNAEILAINQDSWGIQGRRYQSVAPQNTTRSLPNFILPVLAPCDASNAAQLFTSSIDNSTGPPNNLYVAKCDASDKQQQFSFSGSALVAEATGQCLDSSSSRDPAGFKSCDHSPAQAWTLDAASHISQDSMRTCLDVYNFQGPDVQFYGCKAKGDNDGNQIFYYDAASKLVHSNASSGLCLRVASAPSGVRLQADVGGQPVCVSNGGEPLGMGSCTDRSTLLQASPVFSPALGAHNYSIGVGIDGTFMASGPLPHTKYLARGRSTFTFDASRAGGSPVQLVTDQPPMDDDAVGHIVPAAKPWCLEAARGGNIEVWMAPLSGHRFAVVVFNRSPSTQSFTVDFSVLGFGAQQTFKVRDVWLAKDMGSATGSYTCPAVPYFGVTVLVLSE